MAKITFAPPVSGQGRDKIEVFINQLTEGTPNVSTRNRRYIKFNRIAIANFSTEHKASYDEIRIGTTYASVTPVAIEPIPVAPTGLSATANSFSEITLNWTDASINELNFELERSPDGLNGWTLAATRPADTNSFQNIRLTASTPYFYRIRASNPSGKSAYSNVATATTAVLPPLVPLTPVYLPFADEDGTDALFITPVSGFTAFTLPGIVRTSSALSYPGITSSGNGFATATTLSEERFFMTLDTSLSGFARYLGGGQIGGSGLGVIYVRWLARGINAQEANAVEFRTGLTGGNGLRAAVGTSFGKEFIRAMASSSEATSIDRFDDLVSTTAPSAGTDLYVARFTFSPTGVTTLDVFVNQLTEGTPNSSITGAITFSVIGFSKFGPATAPSIDEFRIATTWADAVMSTAVVTPLQTWFGSFGIPTNGMGTGSLTDDSLDRDGAVNLLEYAFGGSPLIADGGNSPTISKVNVSGSEYLAVTFLRRTVANSGVTYTPESSGDLADWSGVPVQVGTAVNNGNGTETVVFRDTVPLSGSGLKRFLRVRVTATVP